MLLQSAPVSFLESHELSCMTLEYRRECGRDSVLQSMTAVSGGGSAVGGSPEARVECEHLLQLEGGSEVVRARTEWRPKRVNNLQSILEIPTESS